jgi:hypothetical protein
VGAQIDAPVYELYGVPEEEFHMKSTDRFLIGIVVGIILLVVAAFVVTLTRPEPTYQAEDVAHNYLLALQEEDHQRAYGYLSPTLEGYPVSVERFAENVEDSRWRFRLDADTTLAVESVRVTGNRAVVDVRESRFHGEWKIVDSDYYFARCWKDSKGCK